MRVVVRHGHFAIYSADAGDIGIFMEIFGHTLVRESDYYTFPKLRGAKGYSIQGIPYQGVPATKTFAGEPWEVMRENGLVYSLSLRSVVPKASVATVVDLPSMGFHYLAPVAILQPGIRDRSGQQVLSYEGEWLPSRNQLRVTEYAYE